MSIELTNLEASRMYELLSESEKLRTRIDKLERALKMSRRAIGEHNVPGDCFATGPLTGDSFVDLVECPACLAIAEIKAVLGEK